MGDEREARSGPDGELKADETPAPTTSSPTTASVEAAYNSVKDPIKVTKPNDYGSIEQPAKPPFFTSMDLPGMIDYTQYNTALAKKQVLHHSEVEELIAEARHHLKRVIVCVGLGMGTTAGATAALTNSLFDNTGDRALYVGVSSAAAALLTTFTKLYYGPTADVYGRKPFILMACLCHTVNALMLTVWPTLIALIIALVITSVFCVTFLLQTIVTDLSHNTHSEITGRLGKYLALAVPLILFGMYMGSTAPSKIAFIFAAVWWGLATAYMYLYFPETLPLSIYYEFSTLEEAAEQQLRRRALKAGLSKGNIHVEAYTAHLEAKYEGLESRAPPSPQTETRTIPMPKDKKVAKITQDSGIDVGMVEKRTLYEYNPVKTLRILLWTETTRTLTISWFMRSIAVSAVTAMFLTYTDEVYNWGTGEQTRYSLVATASYGLSNCVIGYFVREYGSGWVVLGGSMMTLAGFLLMTVSFNDVLFQFAGIPMIPLGIGWNTAVSAVFAGEVPRSQQAAMQAAIASVLDFGTFVGSGIATGIMLLFGDDPVLLYAPQSLLVFSCVMLLASAIVAYKAVYYDGNPLLEIDDEDLKLVPYSVIEQFHPGLADSYNYQEDSTGSFWNTNPDKHEAEKDDPSKPIKVTKSEEGLVLNAATKEAFPPDGAPARMC
uniref:Major facilitator superfamily (MFS) profile domain-containing protein n=1 Tax=Pyramimonas obovata TaxID=1411642 RepID=A0A7S0QWF5_9CHLO|mmetsp:Transcript_14201/g.30391  ORF Transcript_14201/g.30391 Transcript_14201/m.30391 type:complete len:662 (+) Transcript_14201:295-2280(+)